MKTTSIAYCIAKTSLADDDIFAARFNPHDADGELASIAAQYCLCFEVFKRSKRNLIRTTLKVLLRMHHVCCLYITISSITRRFAFSFQIFEDDPVCFKSEVAYGCE